MPALDLILDSGHPIRMSRSLAEGGEGKVYLTDIPNVVAKVYLRPPSSDQIAKLQTMTALARSEPSVSRHAAWPQSLIYERNRVVGFTMPLLASPYAIHELFGYKRRQDLFPQANWHYLVHVAVNLAAAFESLHFRDVVIGDVNSNNIVVEQNAIVYLIDCDSFQIRNGSRTFLCTVGVPEYQPRELQNVDLARATRTAQQDDFGLAAIIFQLLFVGKHPFVGIPPPTVLNCGISDNILAGRYFYGTQAARDGLRPPPNSVALGIVTPVIRSLFEQAFLGAPNSRPSATSWKLALQQMEKQIRTCSNNPSHRHLQAVACPWCALETKAGIYYFVIPVVATSGKDLDETIWRSFTNADIEALWSQICSIQAPPQDSISPSACVSPKPEALPKNLEAAKRNWFVLVAVVVTCIAIALYAWGLGAGFGFAAVGFAVLLLFRPDARAEARRRRVERDKAQQEYNDVLSTWNDLVSAKRFREAVAELDKLRQALTMQRQTYEAELKTLEQQREKVEREKFLDTFEIRRVKIRGVGEKRLASLLSFNVETAQDIVSYRLDTIPRLPNDVKQELLAWRRQVESRFRFDPKKGVDPRTLQALKQKHVQFRTNGRQRLQNGPQYLRGLVSELTAQRKATLTLMQAKRESLERANRNLSAITWLYKA